MRGNGGRKKKPSPFANLLAMLLVSLVAIVASLGAVAYLAVLAAFGMWVYEAVRSGLG